jgi:hypothetical protein
MAHFPKGTPSEMRVKSGYSQDTNSVIHFDLTSVKGNSFEAKIAGFSYFITDERWLVQDGEVNILKYIPLKKEMK